MTRDTTGTTSRHTLQAASLWACVAALLAGCSLAPKSTPQASAKPTGQAPPQAAPPVAALNAPVRSVSRAGNALDYRRDVALHLYSQNSGRIYSGKLPPLLYAVGVLETDIDARGYVTAVRWMRAPTHAPEVMSEIERTVRQAAPYPAPIKLGKVSSTETWLWHKSGHFQLHTLSEGQL